MANGNMGMMAPPGKPAMNPEPGPMQVAPVQQQAQQMGLNIDQGQFAQALNTLDESDIQALETHLTPVMKKAVIKLLGPGIEPLIKDLGPEEPTINIPVSVVAQAYPADSIESSIEMMGRDFAGKAQNDIPKSPQGGLGGEPMMESPQTNVPPMPPMA